MNTANAKYTRDYFSVPKGAYLEKICIVLLAICPILQHYKGLYVNAAVSVLLIVFPYVVIRLINKKYIPLCNLMLVLPLVLYFMFKVVDHGTTVSEFGQAVIFSVVVVAIANGCLSTRYFVRVIICVSLTASICIVIQYICYYLFHFHLQLVPTSLLLERSSQWIKLAQTGRASVTGRPSKFYRPSAFFLEPSHMFIYMFMPLTIELLSTRFGKREKIVSLLLSLGMVLSTSGMGIAAVIGLWMLFLGKNGGKNSKLSLSKILSVRSVILLSAFAVLAVIMFVEVPFFRNSIARIFTKGRDYTNAISGRVSAGNELVSGMRGKALLIGVGDTLEGIDYNMSGFNSTLYRYGLIGTVLSYIFYVRGLFRLKNQFFWISAIVIVLSYFSSHTHSTFFMIYSVFVFIEGYNAKHFLGSAS